VVLTTGFLDLSESATLVDIPKLIKPFSQQQLQAAVCESIKSKE
jgi:hypothetical protein